MEAIFPGIHKLRPDIAQADAEAFLAYGHKQDGFDLDDPAIRAEFLDGPDFIRFKVKPPESIQAQLEALPENWEDREECHARALAITDSVDKLYDLRKRGLASLIVQNRELWIGRE